MGAQIAFYEKNKADLDAPNCVATASQGVGFEDLARNRSNDTWWATSASVDSDNTTYEMDLVDLFSIDTIILVGHNFKSYTLKYWDGSAYQDFSTAIAPTTNTATTTVHSFTAVDTTKVKLTILGTTTVDIDKVLAQFIITKKIVTLNGWPVIKNPTHDKNISVTKMVSGKANVAQNLIGFSASLEVVTLSNSADLAAIDRLYFSGYSFLVWLCGGNESQFGYAARGFRLQDIYLVQCVNQWTPEPYNGIYGMGYKTQIKIAEVIK